MNRREELSSNLATIKSEIPAHVKLIVVTKTFPASDVQILKDLGVEDFGENRDQEGSIKAEKVSATWHFQGQLQSNKLKDRKSTRLNSSHVSESRMPSSA